MRLGVPRSPVLILLLCFITCGLYYLYFIYVVTDETQKFLGDTEIDMHPCLEVLLTIITFGLWNIYWDYRMGKRMARMCQLVGLPITDNAVLYLVLDLFGVGIINAILEQDTLNRVWRAATYGVVPAGMPWPPPGTQIPGGQPPGSSNDTWYSSNTSRTPRQPRPPRK
jgi:hypothetical protein